MSDQTEAEIRNAALEEAAKLMDQTSRSSGATLIRALKSAPAAEESAKCVGCEGKPSGDNVPCVVCGADSAKGAEPDIQEKLKDPNVVHVNMLRGTIAPITFDQLAHILGDEATAKWIADRQQRGGDVAAVLRQFLTGDGFIAECDIPHIVHALTARKGESNE